MSIQTVIGDVSQSLENLLREGQQPKDWFRVSLESPSEVKTNASMKPQINLYLLHLKPNPTGNGPNWEPQGPDRLKAPDLALHLVYLMTPFAKNPLDEHRVLGTAMSRFHDAAVLAPERLHGALAQAGRALKIDLCTYSLEDQTNIWSALGSPYRTSVFYRVRVVFLASSRSVPVRRAKTFEQRIQQTGSR